MLEVIPFRQRSIERALIMNAESIARAHAAIADPRPLDATERARLKAIIMQAAQDQLDVICAIQRAQDRQAALAVEIRVLIGRLEHLFAAPNPSGA